MIFALIFFCFAESDYSDIIERFVDSTGVVDTSGYMAKINKIHLNEQQNYDYYERMLVRDSSRAVKGMAECNREMVKLTILKANFYGAEIDSAEAAGMSDEDASNLWIYMGTPVAVLLGLWYSIWKKKRG